jgi:hypothetical protein
LTFQLAKKGCSHENGQVNVGETPSFEQIVELEALFPENLLASMNFDPCCR